MGSEATWGSVCASLRAEAELLRTRDGLDASCQLLLRLEGVTGPVAIGPRGADGPDRVGLDLHLEGPFGALTAQAVGLDWVIEGGCETPLAWTSKEASLSVWQEALNALRGTGAATPDAVDVRAIPGLPATTVVAFVDAASRAGVGQPRLLVGGAEDADMSMHPLRWLPSHQAPSGAWDDEAALALCAGRRMKTAEASVDPATVRNAAETALALLAFFSVGYTPDGDHELAPFVRLGLHRLLGDQAADGAFAPASGWSRAATQALATMALLEACATTSRMDLAEHAQRALRALGPAYWSSGDDVVAVALVARALHAAAALVAKRTAEGSRAPFELDAALVARVLKEGHGYQGKPGELRRTCGLLIRLSLDPACADGRQLAAGMLEVVKALQHPEAAWDPVHGYLATVVSFEVGGRGWDHFKQLLEHRAAATQRRDGHYCCFKGSWDPPAEMALPGGRMTATTFSILTLEYFYRFDRVFGTR
ncbi:MAG: hypothetical protein AB7I45_17710 [Planctomycetota bacterium]